MGLVGTEQLSTTGMFEKSAFLKGKFLFSDGNHFDGVNIEKTSEDVMVVGGYLIATQYDIPWRKDLFHTNYGRKHNALNLSAKAIVLWCQSRKKHGCL